MQEFRLVKDDLNSMPVNPHGKKFKGKRDSGIWDWREKSFSRQPAVRSWRASV
jgi:hypothetical protein